MKASNKTILPYWMSLISKIQILILIFTFAIFGCTKEKVLVESIDAGQVVSNLCLAEINGQFEAIELDEAPDYLNGGDDGFTDALLPLLKYPAEARENGIEGTGILTYEITKEGTVENIESIQNPGGGIGAHMILILETITVGNSFSPGILNSEEVRVKKEFKLVFTLQN